MRFDDTCPDDWAFRSIESRCSKITSGGTPSRAMPSFYVGNGGIPWVKTKELNNWFIEDTEEHISDEAIRSSSAKMLPKSSVLIAMYGATVGELGILAAPMACNQACCALIVNQDTDDERFLFYQLLSKKQDIKNQAVGAAQQNISAQFVRSIELPTPPKAEQKAIAHILGTLDDKIELNRKTSETLEGIAKALFKSWFVDFEPVRAKAEGRSTGLPDEISELFPDSFEESELGEIPKGWSVGTVGGEVGTLYDGPHATPKEAAEGHIFLGIKNMTGTSLDMTEPRYIGLDDWERWVARVLPKDGDIVFTYEAALGLFAVIPPNLICCLGRRMALIRPSARESTPYFWFHQFIAPPFQRMIDERAIHGATVNRTPLTEFPNYPVLSPTQALRSKFESIVKPLWERIHMASEETKTLTSLRDLLLPKLISGELRVPDAEKMLAEVGI